jgi:photosystem II stability/assembly factor-like uncharacterized protein
MRSKRHLIAPIRWVVLAFAAILYGESGAQFPGPPVTIVQVDPHHERTLVAGTATALLFRSSDEGDTWSPVSFPGSLRSNLHAMLIDPAHANVYLLGVSSETPQYAGVFRTSDEGATWSQLPGMERKQVWALASWQGDPQVVAAGAQDGVYLTRDGGENWKRLVSSHSAGPQPVVSLAFDPTDSNTLYAGTPHLAWKTVDGGATWIRLPRGMEADSDIFSIDVDARRRTRLMAGACSGLYSSLDGGANWSSLERAAGGSNRTYVVARVPHLPNVVFAGTSGGLIQSPDGGTTWHRRFAEAARSIAFDPVDSRRIFVATDLGVLRSEDGGLHFLRTSQLLRKE